MRPSSASADSSSNGSMDRGAVDGMRDQAGLSWKGPCRFRADREIRVLVQHAARDVETARVNERVQVF